jgi:hypothetical protein
MKLEYATGKHRVLLERIRQLKRKILANAFRRIMRLRDGALFKQVPVANEWKDKKSQLSIRARSVCSTTSEVRDFIFFFMAPNEMFLLS